MNSTKDYNLTIIVPVYNEEENINKLEEELSKYVYRSSVSACVLFVDDGSKDKSKLLIQEVCERNAHLFYISFDRNYGLSAAIKAGIDTAQSSFVGYIDADLQTSPKDFELLLPYKDEYEMVVGIRRGRKDSFGKKLSSKVANSFRRMMTKDGVEDTGCPLKIIHTEYAKRIPMFTGMHRFLPALLQLQHGRVKQVPVSHFERTAGQSKFHLWNRLISPFMDCFAFRWMKKRYINYTVEKEGIN